MTARVVVPLALVLMLSGVARAEDKPKIAVLGLEVSGQIDADATTLARYLTLELRARAKASTKYEIAPNSTKDLFDEKLANACENEAVACMSKIAQKYGANWLLYGKIEKGTNKDGSGYQFSLKLLDVDKKTATPWNDFVPLAETNGSVELQRWAGKGWSGVTGTDDGSIGTPIVPPKPPKPGKSGGIWRISAYASGAATIGMLGGLFYFRSKLADLDFGKKCTDDGTGTGGFAPGSASNCEDGPRYKTRTQQFGIGAAVVGSFMLVAIYKGFITAKESPSEQHVGKSTRKRDRFVVTPIVSPDGAGATVQFDW